jgi:hypothetical protein
MQAGDDGEVAGMVGRKVEIVTRSGRRQVVLFTVDIMPAGVSGIPVMGGHSVN